MSHDDTNHRTNNSFGVKAPDFLRKQFAPAAKDMYDTIIENTKTIQNLGKDFNQYEKTREINAVIEAADWIETKAQEIIDERARHKANRKKFGTPEQKDAYKKAERLKKDLRELRDRTKKRQKIDEPFIRERTLTVRNINIRIKRFLKGEQSEEKIQNIKEFIEDKTKKDLTCAFRAIADEYQKNFNDLFEAVDTRQRMKDKLGNVLKSVARQRIFLRDDKIHGYYQHLMSLENFRIDILDDIEMYKDLESLYHLDPEKGAWWSVSHLDESDGERRRPPLTENLFSGWQEKGYRIDR